MNWIDKNLITPFQRSVIEELNKRCIDAKVLVHKRYSELEFNDRLDISLGSSHFSVYNNDRAIVLRKDIGEYINYYSFESLIDSIILIAKEELEKKIKHKEIELIKLKNNRNDFESMEDHE